jgi:hypothetical protein
MANIIDQTALQAIEEKREILESNLRLRKFAEDSMIHLATSCNSMFSLAWHRPNPQAFFDSFTPEERKMIFISHAQAQALLSAWLPGHVPPACPYSFSFDPATGAVVVGERI